jgi:hypothetical protein
MDRLCEQAGELEQAERRGDDEDDGTSSRCADRCSEGLEDCHTLDEMHSTYMDTASSSARSFMGDSTCISFRTSRSVTQCITLAPSLTLT